MNIKWPDNEVTSVLREFIDFINLQVGAYVDGCSGFAQNKIICERQVMRISRAYGMKTDEAGNRIVMRASLEDPTQPDVIHQRIVKAANFISENSATGSHEQQLSRASIIFLFTYWEDEVRPRLARAKNVERSAILSNIMGDLRHIRHAILHKKGILDSATHLKLRKTADLFASGQAATFSAQKMQRIFILIKQDLMRMFLEEVGQTSGPVRPANIRDIAIQWSIPT